MRNDFKIVFERKSLNGCQKSRRRIILQLFQCLYSRQLLAHVSSNYLAGNRIHTIDTNKTVWSSIPPSSISWSSEKYMHLEFSWYPLGSTNHQTADQAGKHLPDIEANDEPGETSSESFDLSETWEYLAQGSNKGFHCQLLGYSMGALCPLYWSSSQTLVIVVRFAALTESSVHWVMLYSCSKQLAQNWAQLIVQTGFLKGKGTNAPLNVVSADVTQLSVLLVAQCEAWGSATEGVNLWPGRYEHYKPNTSRAPSSKVVLCMTACLHLCQVSWTDHGKWGKSRRSLLEVLKIKSHAVFWQDREGTPRQTSHTCTFLGKTHSVDRVNTLLY